MQILNILRWLLWLFLSLSIFYRLYRIGKDKSYRQYIEQKYSGNVQFINDLKEDAKEEKHNKVFMLLIAFALLVEWWFSSTK